MTRETKTETFLQKLKNNPTLSIFIVIGLIVISFASFTDSLHKIVAQFGMLISKEIIVDGIVSTPDKGKSFNVFQVNIIDSSGNPISNTAITDDNGRFILKANTNLGQKLYLIIEKEGCSHLKIPLNKKKTNGLKLRFVCRAK